MCIHGEKWYIKSIYYSIIETVALDCHGIFSKVDKSKKNKKTNNNNNNKREDSCKQNTQTRVYISSNQWKKNG